METVLKDTPLGATSMDIMELAWKKKDISYAMNAVSRGGSINAQADEFLEFFSAGREQQDEVDRLHFLKEWTGLGGNIDSPKLFDGEHETLLISAIRKKLPVVKTLLESGASPVASHDENKSPMSAAVSIGNVEAIELLLEKGASLRIRNDDGDGLWTTLAEADMIAENAKNRIIAIFDREKFLPATENKTKPSFDSKPIAHAFDSANLTVFKAILERTLPQDMEATVEFVTETLEIASQYDPNTLYSRDIQASGVREYAQAFILSHSLSKESTADVTHPKNVL